MEKTRLVAEAALSLLLAALIAAVVAGDASPSLELGLYFTENAFRDTGSVNLVSAIYLGYRAFDTLGETITLLLAVAAIAVIRERRP